ncbi:50S ribosomal protein L11 methyltransferase [Chondrinema litorale]|uniref:50S ribosomal protein L11 methyltransferase n=1 Tax=Chondrinema litorale TaxID=2994555 RepID=UPI0025434F76|nr:50S ribosomal protein L11 methyltransferase [Chondrinema litorale]UZR95910.1 50S ribosomal protein L11 methyltransferase [Chondrinema litorale]
MSYILLKVSCNEEAADLLIAELSEHGFDSFIETDSGFEASVEKDAFNEDAVDEVFGFYSSLGSLSYQSEEVEKQNWNKLWESNYDMVFVNDDCLIRAEFHEPPKPYKYELLITPKMSFGTGHHATTKLMLLNQMETDHVGKKVFEAGSGTGVLSIMAIKLGAQQVDACEVEDWSVENTLENASLNSVTVNCQLGTAANFTHLGQYDIVLANINRNVILEEIPVYNDMLLSDGILILSGFHGEDIPLIVNKATSLRLQFIKSKVQENWVSLVFKKG